MAPMVVTDKQTRTISGYGPGKSEAVWTYLYLKEALSKERRLL